MKCSINHPPSKTGNSKGNRVCGGVYFPLVLFRVIEIDLDQPLKLMVMIIPKYVIYIFSLKIFIDVMYYVWIFLTLIYARLGIYTERSVLAPDPKHTEDYFHWCSCTSSTALLSMYLLHTYVCGALFSWQLRTFSRTQGTLPRHLAERSGSDNRRCPTDENPILLLSSSSSAQTSNAKSNHH